MFESSLQTFLQADATLVSYLTAYPIGSDTTSAIFSEHAPERAEMPYIVYRITESGDTNDKVITTFNIYIDYYESYKDEDRNYSRVNARAVVNRLQIILDRALLEHDRFNYIRLYYYASSPVSEGNSRLIHYNTQFYARAGRKNWIDYITS